MQASHHFSKDDLNSNLPPEQTSNPESQPPPSQPNQHLSLGCGSSDILTFILISIICLPFFALFMLRIKRCRLYFDNQNQKLKLTIFSGLECCPCCREDREIAYDDITGVVPKSIDYSDKLKYFPVLMTKDENIPLTTGDSYKQAKERAILVNQHLQKFGVVRNVFPRKISTTSA